MGEFVQSDGFGSSNDLDDFCDSLDALIEQLKGNGSVLNLVAIQRELFSKGNILCGSDSVPWNYDAAYVEQALLERYLELQTDYKALARSQDAVLQELESLFRDDVAERLRIAEFQASWYVLRQCGYTDDVIKVLPEEARQRQFMENLDDTVPFFDARRTALQNLINQGMLDEEAVIVEGQ